MGTPFVFFGSNRVSPEISEHVEVLVATGTPVCTVDRLLRLWETVLDLFDAAQSRRFIVCTGMGLVGIYYIMSREEWIINVVEVFCCSSSVDHEERPRVAALQKVVEFMWFKWVGSKKVAWQDCEVQRAIGFEHESSRVFAREFIRPVLSGQHERHIVPYHGIITQVLNVYDACIFQSPQERIQGYGRAGKAVIH
jgi:hypothetical protein